VELVGGMLHMETLVDLLRVSATKHGQRTALKAKAGFRIERWTYADLRRFADRLAAYLRRRGIAKGDRVVLCAPNQPSWVGAFFGCLRSGTIVVPLDVQSPPDFVAKVIDATGPKLIFASRRTASLLQNRGIDLLLLEDLDKLLDDAPEQPDHHVEPQDIAEIVFTSGTTGDPKGVVLTHRNILSNVEAAAHVIPGKPSHRLLSLLPLSHMFEQSAGLFVPLGAGARIVYPSSRQSGVIARVLKEDRITGIIAVPQILTLLMNAIEREVTRLGKEGQWARAHAIAPRLPMFARRRLFKPALRRLGEGLQFIVCGGSYLDPQLAHRWENFGIRIVQGYGATEASPFVASNSLKERRLDSVGRPLLGQQVRIATDGEILIKGPNVFSGYWRNPEATQEVMEDGWYRTGDLGYLDEEGFLYFKGRKKNLIVLADGRNVYPKDIEPILNKELDQEAGEEAIVLGLTRDGGVTEVHAVLLMRDASSAEEVVRRTNSQLAEHQRIRGFTLWPEDDFPRTHALKVQRHLVVQYLTSDRERHLPAVVTPRPPVVEVSDVRRILGEVCSISPDQIADDSRISDDLNLDSLGRVELLSAIEADLGVYIDERELGDNTTVGDLERLVTRHSGAVHTLEFRRWPLTLPIRLLRRGLHSLCLFPILWLLTRARVIGRENLKGLRGPVLFVANHSSHLDSLTTFYSLPARVRNRVAVAAAEDYFFQSGALAMGTSLLINAFPFARQGSIRPSIEYCGKLLDQGWSVLIYPEGTRSTTGEMGRFKSGTGLLGVELKVPVVPIRLIGLDRVLPKGRSIPRPSRVEVRIGKPLSFTPGTSYIEATQAIQKAVKAL